MLQHSMQEEIIITVLNTSLYSKCDNEPKAQLWVNDQELLPYFTKRKTTDVLTAATSAYTYGAGITAAAGTRLALHLHFEKIFNLNSIRFQELLLPLYIR
jgi:hypothetical protein